MEEPQAHKMCIDAGFTYKQGVGYIMPMYHEGSKELSQAKNYLWDEFDCMFIWKEDELIKTTNNGVRSPRMRPTSLAEPKPPTIDPTNRF